MIIVTDYYAPPYQYFLLFKRRIRMNKIVLIFGVLFIVIAGCLIGTSLSHLEDEDVIVMDENAETVEMEQPSNT